MSTHINNNGLPHMVDVGRKPLTRRRARAAGFVLFPPEIDPALLPTKDRWDSPKGPIFQTAVIAGIQGAKQTSALIPLCHTLPLTHCEINITPIPPPSPVPENKAPEQTCPAQGFSLRVECIAETTAQTGVEMEALTAVAVACLTIYDMGKSVVKGLRISDIHLVSKTGGVK